MQIARLSHQRLYALRLKTGKSQSDVAHELRQRGFKVEATSISRWERGEHEPRAGVIPALASVYGVSIEEMYGNAEDDEEEDPVTRIRRIRAELVLLDRDDLADQLRALLPR